jgi:hypothetical protein
MPIATAELLWHRAALTSDITPAQNGGRFTETVVASAVKNALFPDVSAAQRAAGAEHWRKVFIANRDTENLTLVDPKISIESGTPGDSYYLLHAGTQTDTQDGVTTRPYGFGTLAGAVLAEATEIVVTTEADFSAMSAKPFQAGDTLRIDARANVLAATGAFEYAVIDDLLYDGDEITITLTAGLTHGYSSGVAVASVLEPADVVASYSGVTTTLESGSTLTYTASGNLTTPNVGTIYQEWTVTITNAATGALSLSGDTLGSVATGSIGANLSPLNPTTGTPYFTLAAAGWGGTAVTGDVLEFVTTPSATPVWYHRIIPAGAAAISDDPMYVCVEAETA